MKKYEILLAVIIGLQIGLRIITFFEGTLIGLLVYALADILEQITIIRKQLERMSYPPLHFNCKYEIEKDFYKNYHKEEAEK